MKSFTALLFVVLVIAAGSSHGIKIGKDFNHGENCNLNVSLNPIDDIIIAAIQTLLPNCQKEEVVVQAVTSM